MILLALLLLVDLPRVETNVTDWRLEHSALCLSLLSGLLRCHVCEKENTFACRNPTQCGWVGTGRRCSGGPAFDSRHSFLSFLFASRSISTFLLCFKAVLEVLSHACTHRSDSQVLCSPTAYAFSVCKVLRRVIV
uniref:Secreted protein n=1 Tax=Canis lupus dingo TaxID=286419 RepID=A0A8C0KYJ2_CANLU